MVGGAIPGLLWDFDGTLVDTMSAAGKAYVVAAGLPGMTPELRADLATIGSREISIRLSLDADDVGRRFQALLSSTPPEAKPLFPGARDILECLPLHALATNGPAPAARLALESHGVLGRFSAVVGTEGGMPRKPDAGLYREIAAGGFLAGLALGDRELDAAPAREMGLPFVAFRAPGLEADYHVAEWDALLPVLLLASSGTARREGTPRQWAEALLSGTDRLRHVGAVAAAMGGHDAAWLHDSGYVFRVTGEHAIDSAIFAASLGYGESMVIPVMLYGGLGRTLDPGHPLAPLVRLAERVAARRPDIMSVLDRLDRADCTTGRDGSRVTAAERLSEARSRVGDTAGIRAFGRRMEELGLI